MKRYCTVFFLIFFSWSLKAHESRPIFIQIKQEKAFVKTHYSVPNTVDFRNLPHLELPQNFKKDSALPSIKTDTEGYLFEYIFQGKIQDLKGQSMILKFPYFNPTLSSVIQIYFENEPETHVLSPENPVLDLKKRQKTCCQVNRSSVWASNIFLKALTTYCLYCVYYSLQALGENYFGRLQALQSLIR